MHHPRARSPLWFLCLAATAPACEDSAPAAHDATADARIDDVSDASRDATADGRETSVDARVDAAADAPVDAAQDVAMDTAADVASDVASEVSADVSEDVAADAPVDVAPVRRRVSVPMFQYDVQRSGANRDERELTPAALRSGRFGRDTTFAPTLDGDVFAQPLFVPDVVTAVGRRDVLLVATQANSMYGLDATTGATLWRAGFEPAVPLARMPCGNIGPTTGIVGTPVYDAATGLVWSVPYNSLDAGINRRFSIHAVDVATGRERLDLAAVLRPPPSNGSTWDPQAQGQRGALALVDSRVYAAFGGLYNDCSFYHGWVIGVDRHNPLDQLSFGTPGSAAGFWAVSGPVGDGAGHLFVTSGNGRTTASMGSYVVRLGTRPTGPTWRNVPSEYYTPSNRDYMDAADSDLGAISPIALPDHPGSPTPHMIFQGSKHGQGYLLNRDDLGGQGVVRPPTIEEAIYSDGLYAAGLYGAPATWTDGREVYIFAPGRGGRRCPTGVGGATALRLALNARGSLFQVAWCTGSMSNPSVPTVSSNGDSDAVLWITGTTPPELRAYEVATGAELYATRGADAPANMRQWTPPIVVEGRVYVTLYNTIGLYRLR